MGSNLSNEKGLCSRSTGSVTLEQELRLRYEQFEDGRRASGDEIQLDSSSPVHVLRPGFVSQGSRYLLEVDRQIGSNLAFSYLMFLPEVRQYDQCLLMGHGLNETNYIKLFPWGYCLSRKLLMPVISFPLAFHINRRPTSWLRKVMASYRQRRRSPDNASYSPFNAIISQRMSEEPERFFRGSLQSYSDILDLTRKIAGGDLEVSLDGMKIKPFREATRVHFLGYSISGYLHLALLLMQGRDMPKTSRCLLFSTCSRGADMDPVSFLVIDKEAFVTMREFYRGHLTKTASREFLGWFYETELGVWFQRFFLDVDEKDLRREIHKLAERLLVIADPKDPVFPLESIAKKLGEGVPVLALDLGRHEFPFNVRTLENRRFRDVGEEIRKSYVPSAAYWPSFSTWLEWATAFFQGERTGVSEMKVDAYRKADRSINI